MYKRPTIRPYSTKVWLLDLYDLLSKRADLYLTNSYSKKMLLNIIKSKYHDIVFKKMFHKKE